MSVAFEIDHAEADWIKLLRRKCDETSQKTVSDEVGYSTGTINQVLHYKYPGNNKKVELAVMGAYEGRTVNCPVLGELETNMCLTYQRRRWAPTNPNRVKLFRACRNGCPHSKIESV